MRTVSDSVSSESLDRVSRELDAAQLGRALVRHRTWLIVPALLCALAATVGVFVVKPRYTAEAKIFLENQENFFTRPDRSDAAAQPPLPDDEAVQSQVQLVTSRDVARIAIKRLDLAGNAEFDPAAGGLGAVSRLLVLLGLERDPLGAGAEDRLLTSFFDRLNVYPITRSRVLSVQFTSLDPDLAAKAANTVSDLYIGLQSDAKRDGAKAAAASLASLIADLRVKAAAADTKAQDYRARNGLLVGTNNTTITSQQLSDLTTQMAQARNAEADSQARAKLLKDMIRQNRITDVPDVANSDLIRRISEQRIALKAQIAQQAITLLPGHPRMRELTAQLADLDTQLRLAAEKVVRTLENDARIAAGRVENLKLTIDAQTETASTATVDQATLNELEQQARLLKDQLDFNTQKYQEALARETAVSAPADARVISRAIVPEQPSFPKKLPTIAIFTLAGLLLSIGVVIARELFSGRAFVDTDTRLRPAPPMPVSASVPLVVESPALSLADAQPAPEPAAAVQHGIEPAPLAAAIDAPAVVASHDADDALRRSHDRDDAADHDAWDEAEPAAEEHAADHAEAEADDEWEAYEVDVEADEDQPEWAAMLGMVADHQKDGGGVRLIVLRSADAAVVAPEGSLALARGLARRSRVILVDCGADEGLDALLAASRGPDAPPVRGLRDLLAGDTGFAEVIHRDPGSRLHIVPFGAGDEAPSEGGLGMLVEALAETYDHVVMTVPSPTLDGAIRGAAQADVAILFVTAETDPDVIDYHRAILHRADVPSVYVLDVADLDAVPGLDRDSAAA